MGEAQGLHSVDMHPLISAAQKKEEDFDAMYRRVPACIMPTIRTASKELPYAVTERGNVTSTMCQS